ncbi:glycosyltransferase family 39 protein [Candidatus Sumerlaeota bacterium]|nr:glycosyltransferase family 39 protein [Candidatus Sumerlaeota bacterium]
MRKKQKRRKKQKPETSTTQNTLLSSIAQFLIKYRIVIIFSIALLIRIIHIISVKYNYPFYDITLRGLDQNTYYEWAMNIKNGDWLSKGIPVFYYGPLYAYFLAIVFTIVGIHFWVVYVVQALIDTLSAVVIALIGECLFGKTAGLLSGLTAAVCASFIFYSGLLLMESLILFLLMSFIWSFLVAMDNPRRWWVWLGSGALLALATIGRGNSLLLVPVITMWLIYKTVTAQPKLKTAFLQATLCFLASFWLVILPVTLHNRLYGGKWHLTTSNGPILFFIGNVNDNTTGTIAYTPTYRKVQQKYHGAQEIPWLKELLIDIRNHPLLFIRNLLFKAFLFFNGYDIPDNVNFYLSRQLLPVLRFNPVHYHLIVSLGIIGFIFALIKRVEPQKVLILTGFLVFFALSIIVMFVVGRYRLSFLGAMIPFFAFFIMQLYTLLARRKALKLLLLCVCAGILYFALGFYPRQPIRYNDYQILGSAFNKKKDSASAEHYFILAFRANPYDLKSVYNLLYIYKNQHRKMDAERLINRLLQYYPDRKTILKIAISFFKEVGDEEKAMHYYKMFRAISLQEKQ